MNETLNLDVAVMKATKPAPAIPYMGSKRRLSMRIYDAIVEHSGQYSGTFVDVFTGGFAMGAQFLQNGWQVIANDRNRYVIALLEKVTGEGLPQDIAQRWVSRTEFEDVRDNPDKYDDWWVGYVLCGYSFGNNQKSYLFGREVEPLKMLGHEVVTAPTVTGRRLALRKLIKELSSPRFDLEQLERLEQLQQLQQLELLSVDYQNLRIPDGAIVYCDPPYIRTATYRESIDHDEFYKWVRNLAKRHRVYISSYEAPDDFEVVAKYTHNSTLSARANIKTVEKLFYLGDS